MASLQFSISSGALTVMTGSESFTVDATSGRGASLNRPQDTHRKDQGPIPIGQYMIYVSELSDPCLVRDLLRRATGDWGDWRVALHPAPKTKTFGRSDFFLHGGGLAGSKGCIDIGGGLLGDVDTERVKSALLEDKDGVVPLEVVR